MNDWKDLTDISELDDSIKFDIRYLTKNNFTNVKIYNAGYKCLLRKKTANKLLNVQKWLKSKRLSLIIFDAYRPYKYQKLFWDIVKDERYVVKWPGISIHNKGAAVDLSIINEFGQMLNMGTDFDVFSEKSSYDYKNFDKEILSNRKLLRDSMINHGFSAIPTEWWHFNDIDHGNYDVLDIDFIDV